MAYFGVTTAPYKEQLASMGLTMIEPNNLDEIPKVSKVFIYDRDGVFDKNYLKALVNSGCTISYTFKNEGANNVKYLSEIGIYSCYENIDTEQLTAEFIAQTLETRKSYEDVQKIINKSTTISSLNVCLNELDTFLQAINHKDKDKIIELFSNLEMFLTLKSLVNEKIGEGEIYRRKSITSANKVTELNNELNSLQEKIDNIIKAGRVCEDDNKRLSAAITSLDAELTEKDEELNKAAEQIAMYVAASTENENKITDLNSKLAEAISNADMLRAKNETLLKQINTYSTAMGKNLNVEDVKVNLTNTGSVNKILYVKAIDMVPYLVSSLKGYPKYVANSQKRDKGCAFLLITPSNSTIFKQYADNNPVLTDTSEIKDCKNCMYVLEGFNTIVEKFIIECDCSLCLILDLSLKNDKLTTGFKQKEVYVVNNAATIEQHLLNPKECISFTSLVNSGVVAHIPSLSSEELTTYKGAIKLKSGLYTILDKLWG